MNLVDGMILVAATAFGLGLARLYATGALVSDSFLNDPRGWDRLRSPRHLGYGLLPCLMAWSVGMLLIRARSPRPRRTALADRPGSVALLAILPGLAAGLACLIWTRLREDDGIWRYDEYVYHGAAPPGLAVAASWAIQAIGGRWRPEVAAIDRLGRLLGAAWVAMAFWWARQQALGWW